MNVIPSFFSVRVIVAVFKVFFAISTVISSLISDHIFNIPWTFSKSLMSILNVAHFDCPMSYFLQLCSNFEFTVLLQFCFLCRFVALYFHFLVYFLVINQNTFTFSSVFESIQAEFCTFWTLFLTLRIQCSSFCSFYCLWHLVFNGQTLHVGIMRIFVFKFPGSSSAFFTPRNRASKMDFCSKIIQSLWHTLKLQRNLAKKKLMVAAQW